MARKPQAVPSMLLHKASGQAYININGNRLYLGRHGTREATQRYAATLAELAANGGKLPVPQDEITVAELAEAYMEYADSNYKRADGTTTPTAGICRLVIRHVTALYADARAVDFGPTALRAVRQRMIDKGWARTNINKSVSLIRSVWKWAAGHEMIPVTTYQTLATVEPLKRGRCAARETDPVRPVPEAFIDAVKPHVSRQVWALIQLQLLTAARAGELVTMRATDIDTSGKIWFFRPAHHKTAHHGHERVIYLGPQAQTVVRPYLADRPIDRPLFSPAEAVAELRERRHAKRKTPLSCGNKPGSHVADAPTWQAGDAYTTDTYRRAIDNGCRAADVPPWSPHRLRHNAATNLRRQFGIEAARLILGHRSPAMTALYAEVDESKAIEIAAKAG